MSPRLGLVVGKFLPFHNGHRYVIQQAIAHSEDVVVLVISHPSDFISAEKRAEMMREEFTHASVQVIADLHPSLSEEDSEMWAEYTMCILGRAPDVVFTSETYGDDYARYMGCEHHLVDLERAVYDVSGTRVRENLDGHWHMLPPSTRAMFATRIVVCGAESTGTTTLAEALAYQYDTLWVPEYGREFVEEHGVDHAWSTRDFQKIALRQVGLENRYARALRNRKLICDTDVIATMLFHQFYLHRGDKMLEDLAMSRAHLPALYIVTGDDIPFEQDGTRIIDGAERHEMTRAFEETMGLWKLRWLTVNGTPMERLEQAVAAIDVLPDPYAADLMQFLR